MFSNLRRWLQRTKKSQPGADSPVPKERQCQRCKKQQSFHITEISRDGNLAESHLCEECAREKLAKPYQPASSRSRADPTEDVQIEVERIVITEVYAEQLIVFRETGGERRFPLLTGIFEATALDRLLKGISVPRPLTHDAWHSTIEALGSKVEMARISALSETLEKTYLGELWLVGKDRRKNNFPVSLQMIP
jgi:bifunctional DNase/RNase